MATLLKFLKGPMARKSHFMKFFNINMQCLPQHCMVKAADLTIIGPRLDYQCIYYQFLKIIFI